MSEPNLSRHHEQVWKIEYAGSTRPWLFEVSDDSGGWSPRFIVICDDESLLDDALAAIKSSHPRYYEGKEWNCREINDVDYWRPRIFKQIDRDE